jgi:dephospho-CoA kinase
MIKVGVTGGIGSGKTTFCKIWEGLGAFVVYADDYAKTLMNTDKELITQIKSVFGPNSYNEDGSLNREYLADEAFSKGRVKELNEIVHPVLWNRISELVEKKEKEGVLLFVKEAAILLQNGRPNDLDFVVLLDADQSNRVERVQLRDGSTEQMILDRVSKQQDFDEVKHLADIIIENNEGEKELEEKAIVLYKRITDLN